MTERSGDARMDKKTLEALKGSITKWEHIVDGTGEDKGGDNCPLCQLFNNDDADGGGNYCNGCPVKAHTGRDGCNRTPYVKWSNYQFQRRAMHGLAANGKVFDEESKRLAQAEVDFLKSLLPTEAASSAPAGEG